MDIHNNSSTNTITPTTLFVGTNATVLAFDAGNVDNGILKQLWKVSIGGFLSSNGLMTLVCSKNGLLVGLMETIYALDTQTGKTLWKVKLESPLISLGSVDICLSDDGNSVYCSNEGYVTKLSTNGSKLWTTSIKGLMSQSTTTILTTKNPRNVLITTSGEIHRIDPETGSITWKNQLDGHGYNGTTVCNIGSNGSNDSSNISRVSNDYMGSVEIRHYVSGIGGYLVKIDNQGTKITEKSIEGVGYPTVALLHAYGKLFAFCGGIVTAHDPNSLERTWKNELEGLGYCYGGSMIAYTTPHSQTQILIIAFSHHVIALNSQNGSKLWYYNFPGFGSFISLLFTKTKTGKDILWAAGNGHVVGLDPTSGTLYAKDGLSGLGYSYVTLASHLDRQSQQASNFLAAHELAVKNRNY